MGQSAKPRVQGLPQTGPSATSRQEVLLSQDLGSIIAHRERLLSRDLESIITEGESGTREGSRKKSDNVWKLPDSRKRRLDMQLASYMRFPSS